MERALNAVFTVVGAALGAGAAVLSVIIYVRARGTMSVVHR